MKVGMVTGVGGFVGRHLARCLFALGWRVAGYDRRAADDIGDVGNIFIGDLNDHHTFETALNESQPDVIFHLAGLIKSGQPEMHYQTNVLGTVAMFESLKKTGLHPMVIISSSSAVYGSGFGGRPITEKFKPRPVTHYAVTKLVQEIVAFRYFDTFHLPVKIVRMFNLLGPGRSPDLACSAFARQIALAESSGSDEIVVGNLGARRDFVDVRDAVRAFPLVAEKGKAGHIYNVCSGKSVLMKKCLDEMLSMSSRKFKVRADMTKLQSNDIPDQVGDARKLKRATGWYSQIRLRQSLSDLLEYWRQK